MSKLLKGQLVTAKRWYMPRRIYGRVVRAKKKSVVITGSFGLEQFHRDTVRVVTDAATEGGW